MGQILHQEDLGSRRWAGLASCVGFSSCVKSYYHTSLMVQWLRCCTSTSGSMSSIPGQGSSTYCMVQPKEKSHSHFWVSVSSYSVSRTKLVVFRPFCGKLQNSRKESSKGLCGGYKGPCGQRYLGTCPTCPWNSLCSSPSMGALWEIVQN